MEYEPRRTSFSLNHVFVGCLLLSLLLCPHVFAEEPTAPKGATGAVVCRTHVSANQRDRLTADLRKISGWSDLKFDGAGVLRHGNSEAVGGSKTARALLTTMIMGANTVVLDDVSRRTDIAFMRVILGQWKKPEGPPAYVVQIDFADFDQVMGDEKALAAFNLGWALLHELDHIANDSRDAVAFGETGECETRINEMRSECNLPERIEYFYTVSPLTQNSWFNTKLMRLAFEQTQPGSAKKKRYWIVWDANIVGGIDPSSELARR